MSTRAATRAVAALEASRKAANLERVRRFRESQTNKEGEYINAIYARVKKGAIPHANSLKKYNITLEKINELRRLSNLEPIPASHIPYFKNNIGQPEPYLPDISEAPRVFNEDVDDNEVQGIERPVPVNVNPVTNNRRTTDFSVRAISVYLQQNPPVSKGSDNKRNVIDTIAAQFGNPSKEWNNTGTFYSFMKHLGQEYVDDVRLIERPEFVEHLKKRLNEKYVGGRNTELKLKTKLMHFETLLKVLKWYIGFDAVNLLKTNNRRWERTYNRIVRVHNEFKARVKAEELLKGEGKPVMDWNELKAKVLAKFPDKTSAENIYIRMYDFAPSRDDFKKLFVDDNPNTRQPTTELEMETVKENTLYIKPNMKQARFLLVNYKTRASFGIDDKRFPESLTDDIREYIRKEKITSKKGFKYLFGAGKMTGFVNKMLNSIGYTKNMREGTINALRKSYVSSQMAKFTGTEKERVELAMVMKHLPTTTLKYARKVLASKSFDEIVQNMNDDELEEFAED